MIKKIDNISVNYTDEGEGDVVLLLHGWGANITLYRGIMQTLAQGKRVIALDMPGFGKTSEPAEPWCVDDYVDFVLKFIASFDLKKLSIVVHSFGGRVGIKIAAKYGYLLNKLVLVDSAGIKPRRGAVYYAKILRHKLLTKLKITHESGSEDYKKMCGTMRETFKNIVNEDLSGILQRITVPTLIIWGNKDEETPISMARKLKKNNYLI